MKFGIYYAYWEKEWQADYKYYIKKVAKLGYDILEIAATPIVDYSDDQIEEIKNCARENGITLTVGHGPSKEHNLSSTDVSIRKKGIEFYETLFDKLEKMDVHLIGGALNTYWPVNYDVDVDKTGDWNRGVEGIREIAKIAEEKGITLCIEVMNRFETYLLNTAEEGVKFVQEVDAPNVKVLLDTFHMNIEEDSIGGAIRTAGKYLGHMHIGESNRKVPGKGHLPWAEIHEALNDIGYDNAVVMEPFEKMGGKVGTDIKVWRDLSDGASEQALDDRARQALEFSRYILA
ncbi:MAG: dolichol monophosphate mannose synthase [Firmicutes bacterium HGW-Firmicutes-3]|jgi:D-psicose/D-tagatose/L-ribulose 3-epimerase|nr:MAG: dolichol monophosphate mannose synthase [Firmicutes bacterium HGW-Firmicutes-3]